MDDSRPLVCLAEVCTKAVLVADLTPDRRWGLAAWRMWHPASQ
ncbi:MULTISPECIES: hypothetical protein [Microbacterium]|nr:MULTISPECIES: hypothetical protein [Microbacterium]